MGQVCSARILQYLTSDSLLKGMPSTVPQMVFSALTLCPWLWVIVNTKKNARQGQGFLDPSVIVKEAYICKSVKQKRGTFTKCICRGVNGVFAECSGSVYQM